MRSREKLETASNLATPGSSERRSLTVYMRPEIVRSHNKRPPCCYEQIGMDVAVPG
jgi:hypothetical protein